MRRLIIMRHAKTERWFEGINDAARALTDRGKEDSVLIAGKLREMRWVPDHALISTARRAIETWSRMKPVFPETPSTKLDDLYLADVSTLLDVIENQFKGETVLLIGHNPGLHELALHFWAHDERREFPAGTEILDYKLPTAAASWFELPGDTLDLKAATLSGMIYPKAIYPE
ncbi:MAG: histidine phosphatase family protein [Pseudomonadota bacterium]